MTAAIRAMRADEPLSAADAAIQAIRDGLDGYFAEADRQRLRDLRQRIARRIEADIAALDMLGGDPDLEPSLGSLEGTASGMLSRGWGVMSDQWAGGSADDREEENEHGSADDQGEESLGWSANVRQIALGSNTADGEHSLGSLCGTAAGCEFGSQAAWAGGAGGDREEDAGDSGEPEEDDDRDSGCGDAEGALEQYGERTGHFGAYA